MPERALDEQLDQIIEAMLTGGAGQLGIDAQLGRLASIAALLRDLPDESFQKRLRADLQRRASMPASTAAPVREGLRTVTPFIAVPKAAEVIEFLKRTLDAEETSRHPHGDGFVSALRVGDSDVLIMEFKSGEAPSRVGAFHVFVPDCDATYNRAIQAGGASLGEPADRPYGERSGFVKDSAGNYWYIATRFPSNVAPQGAGTVVPYLHPAKARPFIDFLKRAFGAEELAVYEHDGRVMHAVARIGDAVLEMGESPDFLASSFYMNVQDCDAVYQRAIEAGATSLWPPTDQAYGERTAGLVDPFGYQWMPATRIQGVR